MRGKWLIALVILLGGWGALELVLWQSELGEYAQSPQRLELRQGKTALVAGGTAGVIYEGHRLRRAARLLIRCQDQEQRILLRPGDVSDVICGVRVQVIELLRAEGVSLLVRWGDDIDSLTQDETPSEQAGQETTTP